jgi:S1-C subfamily serine protease
MLLLLASLAVAGDRTFAFGRLLITDDDVLVGQASDTYRVQLAEHARAAGQPVKGAESVLFDKDESASADLIVGASLAVACGGSVRECEITATWQVLDTAADAVVYEVTTRALLPYKLPEETLGRDLLTAASDKLFARPAFRELLVGAAAADLPPTWSAPLPIARCSRPAAALPKGLPAALDATVVVRAGGRIGSGVVVSPDGFAMTAAHVVEGSTEVGVELRSGLALTAKVVRIDAAQDVAVLDVAGAGHACVPLSAAEVPVGSTLYAVGAPAGKGLEFSVTRGIASGYRTVEGWRLLQTDAAINPGNSGGPLLGEDGSLAAVVSFKLLGAGLEGLGFGVATAAVVDRLGIEVGSVSAADPTALSGRRGGGGVPAKVVDTADPPMLGVRPTSVTTVGTSLPSPSRKWWSSEEKGVFAGLLIGAGVSAIAATAAWELAPASDTLREWHVLGWTNAIGWTGAVGFGTAGILYGANASNTVVHHD